MENSLKKTTFSLLKTTFLLVLGPYDTYTAFFIYFLRIDLRLSILRKSINENQLFKTSILYYILK